MGAIEKTFPLNAAQERNLRNWAEEDIPSKTLAVVVPLVAAQSLTDVRTSIDYLIGRHEALRSRLGRTLHGMPVQEVMETAWVTSGLECDYHQVSSSQDPVEFASTLRAKYIDPIQYSSRCSFYLKGDEVVAVMLSVSHVFVDGISRRILTRELTDFLHGGRHSPESPPQASDYSDDAASPIVQKNTQYWKTILATVPRSCTYSGAVRDPYERVEMAKVTLTPDQASRIMAACSVLRVTPYALWVTSMSALVQRATRQYNQVFRSTYANRLTAKDYRAVAQLAQAAFVPLMGTEHESLMARARGVYSSTLRTYRHGLYDASHTVEWLNRPSAHMGATFQPAFEVNYLPASTSDRSLVEKSMIGGDYEIKTVGERMAIDAPSAKADLAILVSYEYSPWIRLDARRPVYSQRRTSELLRNLLSIMDVLCAAPETSISDLSVREFRSMSGQLFGHRSGVFIDTSTTTSLVMGFPAVQSCRLEMRADTLVAHVQASEPVEVSEMLAYYQARQPWFSGSVVPDAFCFCGTPIATGSSACHAPATL
ncbi:condensation domain-containing protein [Streptomyces sp. SPB162]|uniref:condensation domain-containing protein n=1 Tax=Streptomyces sp. SPB162 TaxID=2940560 RepID=UPI002404A464|nr:condensation domain-containing protein [Streptomyces sp. SPB162]MDF9811462.1 hypothetical protein [Streptomyces sp. SPB162]